ARRAKVRLRYVGHLSQRKGVSYLFEAMRQLRSVATLTLVGPRVGGDCPVLESELKRHDWLGTVPHGRVLDLMAEHDLFVFPSLFEGFALVILEAMAQGLPVIATPNSGGTMVIEDGINGFIVPIRDAAAIAERVSRLAEDRARLSEMSRAALQRAEQMSWAVRANTFIAAMRGRLGRTTAQGVDRAR